MQEADLDRLTLELRAVQCEGQQVLEGLAATQELRLAEVQLTKTTDKLSEARQLQATFEALLQQLSKDAVQSTADLNQVAETLKNADAETAKLQQQLESEVARKARAQKEAAVLEEQLQTQRKQHEERRAALTAKVHNLLEQTRLALAGPDQVSEVRSLCSGWHRSCFGGG